MLGYRLKCFVEDASSEDKESIVNNRALVKAQKEMMSSSIGFLLLCLLMNNCKYKKNE